MYPRRHLPPPPPPPVHIVHTSRSYTPYYDDFQPPSPSISGTTVCLPELTASDKPDSSKAQSSHSTVEPERVGRTRLSDMIRKYDERRVKDVKEDIDSLLVFAGLFSAVLTAFLLESYDTLQENPQDTATQILLQISSQLAALSSPEINNANINLTNTPSSISPFTAATSSVWVNTLWSCSLILSLITSSLGLLVKQWFHEYMDHHESQSLVYLRIRFFRNEGLMKWRVFELAAFLPLLLQVSLVLFFIGLSEFLRILNPIVGWATTTVMIIWFIVFAFTTLAPVFSQQCPYNTPLLKGLIQSVRYHLYLLPYRVLVSYIDVAHFLVGQLYNAFTDTNHALKTRLYDWQQALGDWEPKRDDFLPGLSGEAGIRDKDISDLAILVQSDSLFLDDTSKEMIASCAEELRLDSATTALCACLVGAGRGFRPAVVGGVSAPVWIPVKGLPKSSQEPLCRIFFNVIHGEVNRLSRTDS
ncbi:hypothetical protein QCA50_005833 [Cerrena zonata]|uniref:DUF6535 domain-containing protein n=1 Tax=Cerrena zonata TaxID=2478898 RepID=A0AAW0GG84_9APHY